MRKYDGVFFDMDGTLLDTCADLTAALNYAFDGIVDRKLTDDDVRPHLGHGMQKLVEDCTPSHINDEEEKMKIYDKFVQYYKKHGADKTKAFSGTYEFIRQLKEEGYKVAVVTNKNDDVARHLVETYFPELVDVVVGRINLRPKKPNKEMLEIALKECGLESERVLYVGDSEVDKLFAKAAGCDYLLVKWGYRPKEEIVALSEGRCVDLPEEIKEYLV